MSLQPAHNQRGLRRRLSRPLGLATLLFCLLLTACVQLPTAPAAPAGSTPDAAAEQDKPIPTESATEAFVREGVLILRPSPIGAEFMAVEDCSAGNCFIYHLDWSPTGNYLLYYVGSYDGSVPHQIRLADTFGTVQTVTDRAAYVQPAGWSWDGTAIVYRTDTDRYAEVTDRPAMRVQEVWTVELEAEGGLLGEPTLHGEVTFGEGCGGGGRSESATLYEREGGFAYGYLGGITAWTPSDVLLYSDNCTTRGVARFDLANDVALEPLPGGLRSLSLNAAGDCWVAINDENQLVTGTPTNLETTVIATGATPELVVYGQATGTIYYTTLEVTGSVDLIEQASATLDPSILIFPYFDSTSASLIALNPTDGTESELIANDGYAYARISERAGEGVIFSRIEDNSELQAAVENENLTAENWQEYLPTVDVLQVASAGSEPVLIVADAEQYTPVE